MAQNSATSPKPFESPNRGNYFIPMPNVRNPPLPFPQIASSSSMIGQPRLSSPQLPQLQHCNTSTPSLDYNTLQQQRTQLQQQQIQLHLLHRPSYPSLNFQNQNNTQTPGARMNQANQQFTRLMAAKAALQREMYVRLMNLGSPLINQAQWTTLQMGGGMSQTGMTGQGRRLPVLPAQAALRFNSEYQMLGQTRHNSSAQSLRGMQTPEMMGALGLNTQIGANRFPSTSLQDFRQWEMRRNLLPQQNLLASPQILAGQGLHRASTLATMSSELSALTQNRQSVMPQNNISPQPHLDLYQHQIPSLLQQQQQQQQQQISTQQQQQQQRDLPPLSFMQQQQQPFPRMPGFVAQESISLTASRGCPSGSGTDTSSEGTEVSSQLLGKRKILDLTAQVDPLCKLDPEVVDMPLEMADNFIDNVNACASHLAKHRKSSTLDSKDVPLHQEKKCHLTVSGHTREQTNNPENYLPTNIQKKWQETVKRLLESRNSKMGTSGAQGII